MKTSAECERERMQVTSALEDARGTASAASAHMATCEACQEWLKAMEVMDARLRTLTYPHARVDLWSAVDQRIRRDSRHVSIVRTLWPMAVALLGWRAVQLFMDLPLPWLQPVVPIAAVVVIVWRLGGDMFAIELTAPELQKRGV